MVCGERNVKKSKPPDRARVERVEKRRNTDQKANNQSASNQAKKIVQSFTHFGFFLPPFCVYCSINCALNLELSLNYKNCVKKKTKRRKLVG